MLETLSLRLRVFLFFAFVAGGAVLAVVGALFLGYRQLGNADALSAFITSGAVAGFVILSLVTWVWLLFDENVAKALENLATDMRARAHADVERDLDHVAVGAGLRHLDPVADVDHVVARDLDARHQRQDRVAEDEQ